MLCGVAAMQLHPATDRGMLERGALAVLLSYAQALPLLGLGAALGLARVGQAVFAAMLGVLGLWLGFEYRDLLINALISGATTRVRLGLPGPVSCLAVGLVLAPPPWMRSWLLPPAAIVVGAMLAIDIKLVDPSFHDPNFLRGALAASLWLVAAVWLTVHLFHRPWLGIGVRILGSWLVAIGLLLGASMLVPRPAIGLAPTEPGTTLDRPASLDLLPQSPPTDRRRARLPEPGSDPSAQ